MLFGFYNIFRRNARDSGSLRNENSSLKCTAEESAKHPYELPPVHYTVIRAMGEQMGVGGDDSWGANVHPEYIPDVTKPVEFTFTFRGI